MWGKRLKNASGRLKERAMKRRRETSESKERWKRVQTAAESRAAGTLLERVTFSPEAVVGGEKVEKRSRLREKKKDVFSSRENL